MIAQRSLWVVLSLVLMYGQVAADPIGTAFTYQGRLVKNGTPVSSLPPHCNFTFGLFPVPAGGSQVGNSPQVLTGVAVTDGLFTVNIDFGAAAIDGTARWLDITVQCPGDAMPAILVPRQELKPAPHAIFGLLAGLAQSLLLPFEATAATSDPMLELTQTGDGPAALFKVQPQPEPPLPEPAVEAISETSAPAIEAANTGGGPAARVWVQPQPEPPLPVAALEVLNDTDGPAATFGIDPEFTPSPLLVATIADSVRPSRPCRTRSALRNLPRSSPRTTEAARPSKRPARAATRSTQLARWAWRAVLKVPCTSPAS